MAFLSPKDMASLLYSWHSGFLPYIYCHLARYLYTCRWRGVGAGGVGGEWLAAPESTPVGWPQSRQRPGPRQNLSLKDTQMWSFPIHRQCGWEMEMWLIPEHWEQGEVSWFLLKRIFSRLSESLVNQCFLFLSASWRVVVKPQEKS